ncbi:uncharacterized protein DUF1403 [Rhodovulum steppense]|uniref:Uncharacterized protein DUF1403 n=2 Tax=Rhodovulum steppense TaxID=540251 RepID=A0A4R1YHV2_9RHOB|nr:uncharacterized protein DUF1403 [Rhodovulum steppense]
MCYSADMTRSPIDPGTAHDDPPSLPSPYDPAPRPEAELWFLPEGDAPGHGAGEAVALELSPRPRPHRVSLTPEAFLEAEAAQAAALARAAAALAALDEAVRRSGRGMAERLALIEAEAMLRAEGGRAGREEIARHLAQALPADRHRPDIARAAWAVRRLLAAPGPPGELRAFLGLHRVDSAALPEDLQPRPVGSDFDLAAAAFQHGMGALAPAHPLTRAAWGFELWHRAGLSAEGAVAEPATAAARIAAQENRALGFAPLSPARGTWERRGTAEARLAQWLRAVDDGARAAMLEIARVETWTTRAREAAGAMKGRGPAALVEALAVRPMLTTDTAATLAGLSRDTAERGLARLHRMGLVRELTGQGRFRLWAV